MRIVIVGCGKVGTSIASQLNAEGHDIVVVDIDRNAVQNLSNSLDVMGIEGNGASYEVLAEAGAEKADLVIAAAALDEVNLYTCLMAKAAGTTHTIARVRNPQYAADIHRVKDTLGLSMSINPELTAAKEMSRLLRFSGALEIDTFSRGSVELIKVALPENSSIANKKISQIDILKVKSEFALSKEVTRYLFLTVTLCCLVVTEFLLRQRPMWRQNSLSVSAYQSVKAEM